MKNFLVLSILMIQALVGFAQTDRQHIRYGNRWFKQDNYVKAEAEYRKAVGQEPVKSASALQSRLRLAHAEERLGSHTAV